MIKKLILGITGLIIVLGLSAQNTKLSRAYQYLDERGEVYFQFQLNEQSPVDEQISKLSQIISIDKIEDFHVKAYANISEFNRFVAFGFEIEVLTPPSMLHQPRMLGANGIKSRTEWDFYPTYFGYLDIMDQFVKDYPDLCEIVTIATLDSDRKIIALRINDSLDVEQNEPEFFYTSSMHGDELTGYIMTLHLIEYLLENYESDDQVTNLVDNIDIYINPLANPDGTYAGGNNTVFGATRGNANGIDFNRNFPDFEDGPHPDGNEWQPETVAFMAFADDHDFVMGANFHGGAEVCNYPWDTWSKRHPDDDWWIYVCRQFADTVHEYAPAGYLTDLENGISNGYDWYTISGGRQDYVNYYHHTREFTAEISATKLPPASQLPDFWDYLHRSLLNYMEQALYGVHGRVTNAVTENSVPAKVFAENHDEDESHVYASLPVGNYHRPIKEGSYDFTFSSFGYYDKTIEDVSPEDMETLLLNVQLQPYVSLTADFFASDTIIVVDKPLDFTDVSLGNNIVSWEWTFEGGNPASSSDQHPAGILYPDEGLFDVSLTVTDDDGGSSTLMKEDYILVTNEYLISDTTIYLCDGLFYDSGGETSNYADNEEYTITFISLYESGSLEVVFFEFDIEEDNGCDNDYIEVFDGMNTSAPLLGKWCGTEIPNSFTAGNINGALTFRFTSNEMMNYPGWKAFVTCDTSVGIADKMATGSIEIFPNPSDSYFTISSESAIDQISIINITGKTVYQNDQPSKVRTLDAADFEKGLYLIKLESQGKVYIEKLILQ